MKVWWLACAILVGASQLALGQMSDLNRAGVDVSVRYFDRRLYYEGDPITVEVTVKNNSATPFRFEVADVQLFNLDFVVTTPTNLQLEHTRQHIIRTSTTQPVFFRLMELAPGEQFGLTANISSYIDLAQPGMYAVAAMFYPEVTRRETRTPLASNVLTLDLRPRPTSAQQLQLVAEDTGEMIQRESLPPDEVVSFALRARQRSQWERFFLYMDVESLLMAVPQTAQTYQRSGEVERRRMLEQFRRTLQQDQSELDLVLLPSDFQVERTTYTPDEATVIVTQRFQRRGFTDVRRYTYYLRRDDRFWIIYDYQVQNLGTE